MSSQNRYLFTLNILPHRTLCFLSPLEGRRTDINFVKRKQNISLKRDQKTRRKTEGFTNSGCVIDVINDGVKVRDNRKKLGKLN